MPLSGAGNCHCLVLESSLSGAGNCPYWRWKAPLSGAGKCHKMFVGLCHMPFVAAVWCWHWRVPLVGAGARCWGVQVGKMII